MSALATIGRIRTFERSAAAWVVDALERAQAAEALNCFTELLDKRATRAARRIDDDPRRYPLAGVPFAAKDLFDVGGRPTPAGLTINRDVAPVEVDAITVRRLVAAGANLGGLANMDECAYGFTTDNAHYWPTHNQRSIPRWPASTMAV